MKSVRPSKRQVDLIRTVHKQHGARAAQRTLALLFGHGGRRIEKDALWQAMEDCGLEGSSVLANRSQNMKKDGAYFAGSVKQGWKLTARGKLAAKELVQQGAWPTAGSTREEASGFVVTGPLKVTKRHTTKRIEQSDSESFWRHHHELADERGCYVFGVRSGGGMTPWYAGKTAKSFKAEVFTPANRDKYNSALAEFDKGTPVVFLVYRPGDFDAKHVAGVEKYLIRKCYRRNAEVKNKKDLPVWEIEGVTNRYKRPGSGPAGQLCQMLGLQLIQVKHKRKGTARV